LVSDEVYFSTGDFYTQLESKKWTERKEPLDNLAASIEKNPKLDTKANYNEIVNALKHIIAKDANIQVVASAVRCLTGIANGLRAKFAPFATNVFPDLIDKLKDKKPAVVDPVKAAMDAVLKSVGFKILS
jgi:cytoskeleton-associated protein 5